MDTHSDVDAKVADIKRGSPPDAKKPGGELDAQSPKPDSSKPPTDTQKADPDTQQTDETSGADTKPPIEVPVASCDKPVGGPVVLSVDHAYEAFPGYDEELAALDLGALPKSIDLKPLNILEWSMVAYILEIAHDKMPEAFDRDTVLAQEPMGKAVLGAFAEASRLNKKGLNLPFLRRGLHRFYQCDRKFPLKLADFKKVIWDFTDHKYYEVHSFPKDKTRRIREEQDLHVYVAETIVDNAVRETEMLLANHRSDGAIDFVAYDNLGNLSDRGEFVTADKSLIGVAAPYGCMSCHFEAGSFKYIVLFPDMQ